MPEPLARILPLLECDVRTLTARVGGRTLSADSVLELRRALVAALYDVLHAGRSDRPVRQRRLRDPELEARFAAGLPDAVIPLRTVVHSRESGRLLIERDGVRTWIAHKGTPPEPGSVAEVRVPAGRPALSPGFFLADSGHGVPGKGPVLRMYVHVADAAEAPSVWARMLAELARRELPYRAKVCSNAQFFPRRDALVLYLAGSRPAFELAGTVSALPGIAPGTSAFAHRIADGVAIAWEPQDSRPGMVGLSFGEHRSAAIAAGLIDAARNGKDPRDAVIGALQDAGIDPAAPWRNENSPG